eukprot:7292457-Prymnesium_polylepis.2
MIALSKGFAVNISLCRDSVVCWCCTAVWVIPDCAIAGVTRLFGCWSRCGTTVKSTPPAPPDP